MVELSVTPDRNDGERLKVTYCGFFVALVRTDPSPAVYSGMVDAQRACLAQEIRRHRYERLVGYARYDRLAGKRIQPESAVLVLRNSGLLLGCLLQRFDLVSIRCVVVLGTADSGMFETSLRDERFLPFEGAGAVSTWTLSLPAQLPAFDYTTSSDVILHIRYTAIPPGTRATRSPRRRPRNSSRCSTPRPAARRCCSACATTSHPVNGTGDFAVMLEKQFFPYAAASAPKLTVDALTLYANGAGMVASVTPATDLAALSAGLTGPAAAAPVTLPADDTVMVRDPAVQVFLVLQYHFGTA